MQSEVKHLLSGIPEWLFFAVAAPFIGSFLGVVVVRLPAHRSVVFGPSLCDACGHALGARDLVPVLSWLASGRRCRYCRSGLGFFFPFIELAALAVALWAATVTNGLALALGCAFGWTLLTLAAIDWRDGVLPDVLTLPLLAAAPFLAGGDWRSHVIGAAAGFAVLAGVAWLYRRLRGRDGLGMGDAKLFAALGAWTGWQGLPEVLLIASLAGLLFVLVRSRNTPLEATSRIAFGPFLALGGWIVWLYGPYGS
jgi:leader peptidase (prepilin peptidase)/N-methyltransferase